MSVNILSLLHLRERRWVFGPALLCLLLFTYGCATTSRDAQQFSPIPPARVGASSLDPVTPRSVTDLLRDAEDAFGEANLAQERGDHEAALRHYTLMLELLIEADLDPAIFYSLRGEFGNILDNSVKHASLYKPKHPSAEAPGFEPVGGYSDIQVPFPLPARVLQEIEEIRNAYPKNFQAGLDKSHKYAPYIQAELKKAGIPTELIWMAMVESLFTPKIVSRAGAGGMWQFMRSTGRRYHLRMDSYVDERYDWKSATHAAIGYLTDLHDYFDGDWSLAITAYNMGEGGLERAIASNGGERNFWELIETPPASNRIRLETKKYYPRFLAYLIVTNSPERYGFKVNRTPADNTVRVPVKGMYALEDLDGAMGYPSGTLARLNPALIQEITPATGEYPVSVPAAEKGKFLTALRKVPTLKYGNGTHKVRRGETISQIAQRYGVSQRELMRLNNVRSARSLQAGQVLRMPGYSRSTGGSSSAAAASGGGTHAVKRGDTLFDIARAHGVNVSDLQQWNGMGKNSRIRVGDRLRVSAAGSPAPAAAPVAVSGGAAHHVVKAGEYPSKIARVHGVKLEDLLQWNGLTKRSTIRIGDKLVVRSAGTSAPAAASPSSPPAASAKTTYKVAKGDTAGTIAQKHGVKTSELLAWNSLTARSILRVGQKLTIYAPSKGPASVAPNKAPAAPSSPSATSTKTTYKVAKGDTASTIAQKHGVKTSELLAWNGLGKRSTLQIGQTLNLSASGGGATASTSDPTSEDNGEALTHVVAKGHSPWTIAQRYGVDVKDLFKWNKWPSRHVLQIGDKVLVYKN